MMDKDKINEILEIISFIRSKYSNKYMSKILFWYHDIKSYIDSLEIILKNPPVNKNNIFKIQIELQTKLEHYKILLENKQRKYGISFLKLFIEEIGALITGKVNNELLLPLAKTHYNKELFQNKMNALKRKHNVWTINGLLHKIDSHINNSKNTNEKNLFFYERIFVETYKNFNKNITIFLMNAFLGLDNEMSGQREIINKIYKKFLTEPYSYFRRLLDIKKGLPLKTVTDPEKFFIDIFLGMGSGVCFSIAHTLSQILQYHGFNAYPVLAGRFNEYRHAAVVVDLGDIYLYLDPALGIEKPLEFNKTSITNTEVRNTMNRMDFPIIGTFGFKTRAFEIKHLKYDIYKLYVQNKNKWQFYATIINKPVSEEKLKEIWSNNKIKKLNLLHKLTSLDKDELELPKKKPAKNFESYLKEQQSNVKFKMSALTTIKHKGKDISVNMVLMRKRNNKDVLKYQIQFITAKQKIDSIDIDLDDIIYYNPESLSLSKYKHLDKFNIDLERLKEIAIWIMSKMTPAHRYVA